MRSTYVRYAENITSKNMHLLKNVQFADGQTILYKGKILIGKGALMICR